VDFADARVNTQSLRFQNGAHRQDADAGDVPAKHANEREIKTVLTIRVFGVIRGPPLRPGSGVKRIGVEGYGLKFKPGLEVASARCRLGEVDALGAEKVR
jgi:hypothetical protein